MSLPATRDLALYQGDAYEHVVAFEDPDGEPLDLTGEWRAQIRRSFGADPALAEFSIDTTGADEGSLVLSLTPTQTAGLPAKAVWDLEWVDVHRTYLAGEVTVHRQVTRD